MRSRRDWRRYWVGRSTPEHRERSECFYRLSAEQLAVLYRPYAPKTVLELGCGDGVLFPYFGFNPPSYRGVDLSIPMLDAFRRRVPGIDVVQADASRYRDGAVYDLILCNGLVQYFDSVAFSRFLANAREMMHASSVLVCGEMPASVHRWLYLSGQTSGVYRVRWRHALRSLARTIMKGDEIGTWYSVPAVLEAGAEQGLKGEIYGSMTYMYRFHAVFTVQ